MAFWGIEVKPGKPYTHAFNNVRGRLRITQATLAVGSSTKGSHVQCNVGEKSPVLLCTLMPEKTESLQLDLEFEEAEDVIFSVIGPRGVYLTGYYVGNRRLNTQDDSESFGEDIANTETEESNRYSNEDEYEDSFINDGEPEPLIPSPVSSSRDDDEEGDLKKKRNVRGGWKRLKKKYQSIDSDDEISVQVIDDEDKFLISSICKRNLSEAAGRKTTSKEPSVELNTEIEDDECTYVKSEAAGSPVLDSNKADVHLIDDETKGKKDKPNMSVPPSDEVVPGSKLKHKRVGKKSKAQLDEAKINNSNPEPLLEVVTNEQVGSEHEVKTKKKGKDKSKKGNDIDVDSKSQTDTLKYKTRSPKAKADSMDQDAIITKDDPSHDDMRIDRSLEVLPSAELGTEKDPEAKKKRKERAEVNTDHMDKNLPAGKKQDQKLTIDNSCRSSIGSNQLAEENKTKKKRRKTSKIQEAGENAKTEVRDVTESLVKESEGKNVDSRSSDKRTLSNGLIIEDLVTGNTKGKVTASGRKVKVQYVLKLKESGNIIDSNIGKSPLKFRLGDKNVIEGLNVGLEGMRVGDKRRLVVPPSMSCGYLGTRENVPPNSWLVYDVEVLGVH